MLVYILLMCPQAHMADSCAPQSFNVPPTRAVPRRRRFSPPTACGGDLPQLGSTKTIQHVRYLPIVQDIHLFLSTTLA